MTRSPRAAALAAAACALAVGATAACTPLGSAGGPATAAAPLSTPTTAVSTSSVLGDGVAVPTPTTTPVPVVTTTAVQFVTVTAAPAPTTATPTATPTDTCNPFVTRRKVSVGTSVSVRKGAADVTWRSTGGSSLVGWRVEAVREDLRGGTQPAPLWKDVAAPAGCATITTTMTGLTSGGRYNFLLHQMLSTPTDPGPTAELVGRTVTVTIG